MTGYVLLPRTPADLEEIWDYSAEIWGERYIRTFGRPSKMSPSIRDAAVHARRYAPDISNMQWASISYSMVVYRKRD